MSVDYRPDYDPADVNSDYGHTGGDIAVPTFTGDTRPFRFWCQKALPLVYDDSLSYYEVLCKMADYLNNFMTDLTTVEDSMTEIGQQFVINQQFLNDMADQLGQNVADLEAYINARMDDFMAAYTQLQTYVNNYFDNLDVQEEINAKLDEMSSDGTLNDLFDPVLETWMQQKTAQIDAAIANQDTIQAAQNARISVLEGRMDTFSGLPSGSTSGNAELLDIRTNFLGETYPTAGDAVRASDMIASGFQSIGFTRLTEWDGNESDSRFDTIQIDVTAYKGGHMAVIANTYQFVNNIEQGAGIELFGSNVAGKTVDSNAHQYPFPDGVSGIPSPVFKDFTVITTSVQDEERILIQLAIPEDFQYQYLKLGNVAPIPGEGYSYTQPAAIVYANSWSKTQVDPTLTIAGAAADAKAAGDALDELNERLDEKVDLPHILVKEPITILNGYFTVGGYTANGAFRSAKESVTEGETIYVSGSGTTYSYAYYFVDNNGTVIAQAQTALEMNDYELVVPTGATYIEINSSGTNKNIAIKRYEYADSFIVGVDGVDFVNYSKQYLDPTTANVGAYWNNGIMSFVSDNGWIAFDAFTLPAGTYYSYNIGNIYKKVGNTVSQITKTDITGIPYLHTWSLAEESLIMITAVYGVESNSVVVGDTLNLPKTNELNYYNVRFKKNVLPSNIVVVDKNGNGDYTEIQDALDNIYTDTADNPFTILVMPGEYGKIDMHRRNSPVHDLRYISIIGTDRDRCVISDDKGNYLSPAANIRTNGVIRNLSFINTTVNYDPTETQEHAYAVHEDFGICDVTYENCYMYCEAGPAIGIGMADGKRMRFLNCEFICNENEGEKQGLIGAFFAHSATGGSNNQSIEIKNSIAVNKVNTKGFCIANNVQNSILDVLLIGNVSVGTNGANAYFEGYIDFGYSALNNFEIPT